MEQKTLWIVAHGDAFDGLTFYGPFDDHDTAVEWAEKNDNGEDWKVVPVYSHP